VNCLVDSLPRKAAPLVDQYLRLFAEKSVAEAERILGKIRQEMQGTMWQRGYINALEGMIVALKSGDTRYVYLSRLDPNDHRTMEEARRKFQAEARNPLEGEFDRGFFSAWVELLRILRASREAKEAKEEVKTLNGFLNGKKYGKETAT